MDKGCPSPTRGTTNALRKCFVAVFHEGLATGMFWENFLIMAIPISVLNSRIFKRNIKNATCMAQYQKIHQQYSVLTT